MRLIDAQVHAYERNHKERPWFDELVGPKEVTGDIMVGEMESVGVDGAILREGAQWLIARLLRLSAIFAGAGPSTDACEFEYPAIAHLCAAHSADWLAAAHAEFLKSAQKADGLYLDFVHFLERELTKLYQKSLP